MKASIYQKLQQTMLRHEEIGAELSLPETVADQTLFQKLSKEYADLEAIVSHFKAYQKAESERSDAELMAADSDPELKAMAEQELKALQATLEQLNSELEILMLPKDPDDEKNVYLEIRAGTGGDEAAIFCGDLFRMYGKYAEQKGWQLKVVSESEGEHGGYKEIIARLSGVQVFAHLKFESGAHRVQRVPATESQGRIHTSACTVAIMPEANAVEAITLNPAELRIDTYRASGAGGQHVNRTDSAVRVTHLPTGVVAECQEERSQHQNKAKAMALLQTKLLQAEKQKHQQQQTEARRALVGSGDRSERIRTYNYPQGRVTDHRINLTLYALEEVMEGGLAQVIDPLQQEYHADLLASMGQE